MNVKAHGIDMVACGRLRQAIGHHGERFLHRVFTEAELSYSCSRKREIEHLAGRFAGKEAVLKVLGTGWSNGISWKDVEIRNEPSGRPRVVLSGRCRQLAEAQGLGEILVSITHVETHAIASAIGLAASGDRASGSPD